MTILVDTSGVLAAVDPRQTHHEAAVRELLVPRRRILSPFVLAELDSLVSTNGGQTPALALLRDVSRSAYELVPFSADDVAGAIRVIERYASLDIGLADASIVVLAARYQCRDVLTLDQRHFRVITTLDGQPFRLLPFDPIT